MAKLVQESFDWCSASSDLTMRHSVIIGTTISTDVPFSGGRSLALSNGGDLNSNFTTHSFANSQTIFLSLNFKISGTEIIYVELQDGSTSQVTLGIYNGGFFLKNGTAFGGVITGTTWAVSNQVGVWHNIQMELKIDPAAGYVNFRKNGALTNDFSSETNLNTRNGTSNSYCNRVMIRAYSTEAGGTRVDDLYVNSNSGAAPTSWPGPVRIYIQPVIGAGNSTQFTPSAGSNWQCVDDLPQNGNTDYVQSNTPGNTDLYAVGALPSGVISILGVEPFNIVGRVDAGSRTAGVRHRSGTTESSIVTSASTPAAGFSFLSAHLATDPNTGATWSVSGANGQQVGCKVEA